MLSSIWERRDFTHNDYDINVLRKNEEERNTRLTSIHFYLMPFLTSLLTSQFPHFPTFRNPSQHFSAQHPQVHFVDTVSLSTPSEYAFSLPRRLLFFFRTSVTSASHFCAPLVPVVFPPLHSPFFGPCPSPVVFATPPFPVFPGSR